MTSFTSTILEEKGNNDSEKEKKKLPSVCYSAQYSDGNITKTAETYVFVFHNDVEIIKRSQSQLILRQENYTSLKEEMLKQKRRHSVGNDKKRLSLCNEQNSLRNQQNKKDKVHTKLAPLSHYGIEQDVLESCLGEWLVIDLNFELYEKQHANDIANSRKIREKRRLWCSCLIA